MFNFNLQHVVLVIAEHEGRAYKLVFGSPCGRFSAIVFCIVPYCV